MEPPRNIVGPTARRLREALGLSQADFAAKCQRQGWDISRDIVARIETQVRIVPDFELEKLAKGLNAQVGDLLKID